MVKLVNRAKMHTATLGTGNLTLGPVVDGFQSFADAGVITGDVVRYVIEDSDAWEIGTGTVTNLAMTRNQTQSSNNGAKIALSGEATVFLTAAAEDVGGQTLGAIGTYALLNRWGGGVKSPNVSPGGLLAASALYYANTYTTVSQEGPINNPRPSGTWRCMGNIGAWWVGSWGFRDAASGDAIANTTLWLRVA
jgi:hypothetical protein